MPLKEGEKENTCLIKNKPQVADNIYLKDQLTN